MRLHAREWLCHRDLVLETARPVTLITGRNGVGKTAVRDAIEFVLCGSGRLRGITTKRDLALLSIRDEQPSCAVSLELPSVGTTISRSMKLDGTQTVEIDGTKIPIGKSDERIRDLFGEWSQIRAALEAEPVLSGDPKIRREILFAAAGTSATLGEVTEALKARGLEGPNAERMAKTAVESGFDVAHGAAEEARAERTRILRAPVPRQPQRIYEPTWSSRSIDLGSVTVRALEERADKYGTALARAERKAGVDRGALLGRVEAARSAASQRLEEIEALEAQRGDFDAYRQAMADAAATLDPLQQRLAEVARNLQAIQGGALEKPETCPAIAGGPACPMTKNRLEKHAAKLEETTSALRDEGQELEVKVAAAREEHEAAAVAYRDAEILEGRLLDAKKRHEAAEAEVARAEQALEQAEDTNEPEPEGEDLANPEFIRGRLEKTRKTLAAKRDYDSDCDAARADAETRRTAEEERAWWDRMAKALAPDEIPTALMTAQSEAMVGYLEEIAEGIAPVRLTANGEIEIEQNGRFRRFSQLSESARLRLSILASHMVARASGFPLLVLDRFDHVYAGDRGAILRSLLAVHDQYPEGIVLLSTMGGREPKPPPTDDVDVVWLDGGEARRVAA